MAFKKVVVVGGGVLGSQIAYQVAYKGFDVTVWLRSEGSIERAKPKFARWHETYLKDLEATKALIGTGTKLYPRGLVDDFENLTVEKVEELKAQADQAFESLIYELDMAKAMADADLVIESLSESKDCILSADGTASSGKDSDCDEFINYGTECICSVHRKTGKISCTAFCK